MRLIEPRFGNEQFTVHYGPDGVLRVGIHQAGRHLAQIHFPQTAIMLATSPHTLGPGFFVGTFVQDQQATVLQRWLGADIGLNLVTNSHARPRRIGHELLQALAIAARQPPVDVGIVPLVVHRQLPAHEHIRLLAGIASAGPKARAISLPESRQVIAQLLHGFIGQTPTVRIKQVGGRNAKVIRSLLTQICPSGELLPFLI
jgi:hypothetical protein